MPKKYSAPPAMTGWKSGNPNQCLRLGYDPKTDRTFRARFRERASHGRALSISKKPQIIETEGKTQFEFGLTTESWLTTNEHE